MNASATKNVKASKATTSKAIAPVDGHKGTAALLAIATARKDAQDALRAGALSPLSLKDAAQRLDAALDSFRTLAKDPRAVASYETKEGVRTESVAAILGKFGGDSASVILAGALKFAK